MKLLEKLFHESSIHVTQHLYFRLLLTRTQRNFEGPQWISSSQSNTLDTRYLTDLTK